MPEGTQLLLEENNFLYAVN